MYNLEVGKIYKNGKHTREITDIDGGEIHYKTETGKKGGCWVTTFEDWITKGKNLNKVRIIEYTGELLLGQDEELYVYTDDGVEHDIGKEVSNIFDFKNLGDKKKVRIIIESL